MVVFSDFSLQIHPVEPCLTAQLCVTYLWLRSEVAAIYLLNVRVEKDIWERATTTATTGWQMKVKIPTR